MRSLPLPLPSGGWPVFRNGIRDVLPLLWRYFLRRTEFVVLPDHTPWTMGERESAVWTQPTALETPEVFISLSATEYERLGGDSIPG